MKLDSVLLEILRHKATAAAEEMALTLMRTARTIYIKDVADFGTAIADRDGKFFAYPESIGVSSFVDLDCGPAIAAAGPLEDGDVIITNEPYASGGLATHLPDLQLIRPYFHDGKIVAYGWNFAHTSDIGGGVPSSISPRFSELYQEGLQIPPMKLVERGTFNRSFLTLYLANCRTPAENLGDLKAMLASLETGAARVADIVAAHGVETLLQAQSDLAEYAADKARAVLRRIPDGRYEFWDYLDDDFATRLPMRIRCALTVADGKIDIDFEGTDPQVASAYNVPTPGRRHPWLTQRLMHLIASSDKSAPLNHGLYAHFTARAPKGTIVNPDYPAAVGVRHAPVLRIMDVLSGALAQADSGLMPAAGGGAVIPAVLAEFDAATGTRRAMVMQSLVCGAGARRGADGVDGRESGMANVQNAPVERTEDEAGVTILEYGLRPDSGGPGKWRGGTGLVLTVKIDREGSAVLGRGLERFLFRPWGVAGGGPGARSRVVLNIGRGDERELGKLDMLEIAKGDTVTMMTPGGGGYGDPFERPVELVLDDVRRGFVSHAAAERDYGVVVGEAGIDETATAARRGESRGGRTLFDFGPERGRWESVFSDELVTALNAALLRLPQGLRIHARRRVFEVVAPGIMGEAKPDILAAITDPAVQRARLAAEIDRLQRQGASDAAA
ncbi:MAG: hydantoinase B/oxoprolinase family protein [Rhodospirillaceae bacterium]|nr:hydantoinase B/oxoprolinase family protein [Rhodospirillaceae bacterium]